MLRTDRLCVWIFMMFFALMIPAQNIIRFTDEALIYTLYLVAGADCLINRQWRRYRLLIIFTAIMTGFLLYSLFVVHYNTQASVLYGFILEMKPFIPIIVFNCVAPELTVHDRRIFRGIAIFNLWVLLLCIPIWHYAQALIFGHPAMYGGMAMATGLVYLFCCRNEKGGFTRHGLIFFCIALIVGLLSTRSKYYAEFILAMFLVFAYRQQMTRRLTLWQILLFLLLGGAIMLAVAQKFATYFMHSFDITDAASDTMGDFARLALYVCTVMVLAMHPLFGSGFASYASMASAEPGYSTLYYELGIDKVYGLSPSFHDFVCDAYYPSLVQFGSVGICLFIWFWAYIYRYLRLLTRTFTPQARSLYVIGAICMFSAFIEMTTGTLFFMPPGETWSMLLGLVCGMARKMGPSAIKERDTPLTPVRIK